MGKKFEKKVKFSIERINNSDVTAEIFNNYSEQIKSDSFLLEIRNNKIEIPAAKIQFISGKILELIEEYRKKKIDYNLFDFRFFTAYQMLVEILQEKDINTADYPGIFFTEEKEACDYFIDMLNDIVANKYNIDELYKILFNFLLIEPMVSEYIVK